MRNTVTRPALRAEQFFRRTVLDNPRTFEADFLRMAEAMSESEAKYHGEVIDYLYQPFFFDNNDLAAIHDTIRTMTNITNKLLAVYLEGDDLRKLYGFTKREDRLIRIGPGYAHPAPITRLDQFYSREGVSKFCEFNTDGTSGMNEIAELERVFTGTRIFKLLRERFDIQRWELIESWIDTLFDIYTEWGGKNEPVIAITDWEGEGVREEFEAFRKRIEHRGYRCIITDPRRFEYRKNRLLCENTPVDIVYRRAVNRECFERAEEIRPLLDAYENSHVCMIGPFRSQLLHNKNVFRVLRHPDIMKRFSPAEQTLVRERIPVTLPLSSSKALIDKAVSERESWVLKPEDKYAAKEVTAGRDCSEDEWYTLLHEKGRNGGYLLQEFCDQHKERFLSYAGGSFKDIYCRNVIGLYLYNGKFSGVYTRVGETSIIASLWKCFMLTGLCVSSKKIP